MKPSRADWNSLRVFLATADEGNLAAAARRLGIDHSTAFRRLKSLEIGVDGQLFERRPEGYRLTALGQRLLPGAQRIEDAIHAFERETIAQNREARGTVRISISDSLAVGFLPERLDTFRQQYPDIRLDISVDNQFADLARREADIAVRPARKIVGDLVGRKASRMAYAAYASETYLERHGTPQSVAALKEHAVCGFAESLDHFRAARWLRANVDETAIAMRFDNTTAMAAAARAGLGIAILPCFLGDSAPSLRRIIEPDETLKTDIWVLTHPDLRQSAPVRAVLDFLFAAISSYRQHFEGECGTNREPDMPEKATR